MTDNDMRAAPSPDTYAPTQSGNGSASHAPQPITEEEADLGYALRAIYRKTVEEAIPDEMLDLLKRLD